METLADVNAYEVHIRFIRKKEAKWGNEIVLLNVNTINLKFAKLQL